MQETATPAKAVESSSSEEESSDEDDATPAAAAAAESSEEESSSDEEEKVCNTSPACLLGLVLCIKHKHDDVEPAGFYFLLALVS